MEARQVPSFKIYFADPLGEVGIPTDRYYLQFGGAGLEIKREATKGRQHYNTLLLLNRTPNQYPNNQLRVEIRVDRRNSRLKLLLNGEPEGEVIDAVPVAPTGSGVTLYCNMSGGGNQEVRNIEIVDNDNFMSRRGTEPSGVRKNDSLVTNEEDHWSGRLLNISPSREGLIFHFKNDFQKDPMELAGADVSSVWFADRPWRRIDCRTRNLRDPLAWKRRPARLILFFGQDSAIALHPLLGHVEIIREGILSMEKPRTRTGPAK